MSVHTSTFNAWVTESTFAFSFIVLAASSQIALAQTFILDNFEGSNRIVQPNATAENNKYLWNLYSASGTGTSISTAQKHDGNQSLRNAFSGGPDGWQFQFYTYTEFLPGWTNGWKYMRQFVTNPSTWQMGKINRMRFWIKVPSNVVASPDGNHNFEFGTYLRSLSTGENTAESDNNHWYHFFNFGYSGQWEQVIIDTHPNHIRGAVGDAEHPDQLYPYKDGNTYFDLMTRFYLDFQLTQPADFYMDGFELYQETNPENIDQVRSIHAVYVPNTNEVRVGWGRRKDQETVKHDVRYAFSDIYSTGWAAATPAPGGTITPPDTGGCNGMSWSTTSLNLSGKTTLYVAIKPQNSSQFRQIAIPLTSGTQNSLSPPQNLRITSQ